MIESDIREDEYEKYPSACYVLEERLLRRNLSLIKHVADEAGVEIILAFKAYACGRLSRSSASTSATRRLLR